MPRVEAAFLHAAGVHDTAAGVHDRAAEFFDALGKPELASAERERARADRAGATADRERARLRHEWIASGRGNSTSALTSAHGEDADGGSNMRAR
jgi:regulator of protease activity HflC (stomatin/prohibitin superfamily)